LLRQLEGVVVTLNERRNLN